MKENKILIPKTKLVEMVEQIITKVLQEDSKKSEQGLGLTEGRPFNLGKGYTHFAIDKKTNKIINGWDYKGVDKEDLMGDKNSYFFSDLTDFIENTGTKKSDIKIVTKGSLDKMGVDTSNSENWYLSSNKQVNESYESDEIEKIIEPETEYGYSIVISNSGNEGGKTKYLKASKSQIEKIKQILSSEDLTENKKQNKFDKVMGEFEKGELKSSNGKKVTNKKQALAIAYSESGLNEAYGDKRDFKKIEIFVKGKYVGTTTWAKGLKQAKEKFLEKNSNVKPEDVVVKFAELN
jgi:hypothetical protein